MTPATLEGYVHKSMDILQANLQRMSQLSNNCKAWCITLVSAVLLFAIKERQRDMLVVLLAPVGLFYILDAYYLSVERQFQALARQLADKVRSDTVQMSDVFAIRTACGLVRVLLMVRAMFWSWSTLPFYGTIAGVVVWVNWWKLSSQPLI